MLPGIRLEPAALPRLIDLPPTQPIERPAPLPAPIPSEPMISTAPPAVSAVPMKDQDRLVFRLENDNWFSMIGMEPGSGFGAGDDFGATHAYAVELRLPRDNLDYLFGHSSAVFTREVGPRTTNAQGKVIATQTPVEISKLYFGVELASANNHYSRGQVEIGLRNAEREIPGLAMSAQQLLHSFLPRAPAFDNRASEGMELFGALELAHGIESGPLRAELGATLNTFSGGSRLFALVEADLPVLGGLHLRASQLTQLLLDQSFSFVTRAGASYEFPGILIGVEAKILSGDVSDHFTKFNDRDPLLELRLEVGL